MSSIAFAQSGSPPVMSDAEGMSFTDLARVALARNKGLEVARESLRQAEARVAQGRLVPNPSIDVSRSTDAVFANEGDTGYSVTLSQPVELGGKRVKRIRVAEASVEVTKAEIADAERQMIARLRKLYVDAIAAAARVELLERVTGLNQQTMGVMNVRLRAGDASQLDAKLLAAETNQIEARRLVAENGLAAAILQIRTVVGVAPGEPLLLRRENPALAGVPDSPETFLARALDARPDLRVARLREALAEAGIRLARSQAVPDPTAFVRYGNDSIVAQPPGSGQKRAFEREKVLEVGVSIPLALFNRHQGDIAEATSQRSQFRAERESLEQIVRQEVLLAFARYQTAQRTVAVLQTGVVEQNQDSFRIIQLGYNLGEMRLLDVVNQQRLLIDTQTTFVDAQAELSTAVVDLDTASGVVLP
jgi:cobalt-zinc-cadmium efflux system outer membrane protein